MRKNLIRLHLYAGLLCFPYFIIFGISSLNFNHHFKFTNPGENISIWQKQINIPPFKDNEQFSADVRDSLGLMGWAYNVKKDSTGFRFIVSHPGKNYAIKITNNEKPIRVEETRKGVWSVFISLHGFGGEMPGAPELINAWVLFEYHSCCNAVFHYKRYLYFPEKKK